MEESVLVAYLAGFWEGEGTIAPGNASTGWLSLVVRMANRRREPLDLAVSLWGGGVSRTNMVHNWNLSKRDAVRKFLTDVRPYCLVKTGQVALALEYLSIEQALPGRYSTEQQERRTCLLNEISRLNKMPAQF